jgi:3-oxoacyl-[acyl-carrier protein] reductase
MNSQNRVAIIGGGSKGLGKGCAIQLAKAGIDIVICARGTNKLDETRNEIQKFGVRVLALSGDMADPSFNNEVIEATIKEFGRIDILVNNSGGPKAGKFDSFEETDWQSAFDSVLMYAIRMTKLALPHMKNGGWGRIVNIASLSVKEPAETLILSNVFRAGILAFSKSISKDLIKSGITINTICPGAFMTDRAKELIANAAQASGKSTTEVEMENQAKLPLGRYQTPEELGAMVNYLCSELAGGVTGTVIQIDGGISNGLL